MGGRNFRCMLFPDLLTVELAVYVSAPGRGTKPQIRRGATFRAFMGGRVTHIFLSKEGVDYSSHVPPHPFVIVEQVDVTC